MHMLKNYSHDLARLFSQINRIHDDFNLNLAIKPEIDSDTIFTDILSILTDYASKSRYYNLDEIMGNQQIANEPLKRWEENICAEIVKQHFKKPKIVLNEKFLSEINGSIFVRHTSADGKPISDFESMLNYGDQASVKQKHLKYYLYKIANYTTRVLMELECIGNFFPHLREFFEQFLYSGTKKEILARRLWRER